MLQHNADRVPLHLLVDSTGLKLCGAGEWLVEKHGTRKRRSWRKLHIGVDANTGKIVAATLTTKDVDDASEVAPLLKQVEGPLASFTGDGGYDQDKIYDIVTERDPEAAVIVPPRSTAALSETAETKPTQRDRICNALQRRGGWAEQPKVPRAARANGCGGWQKTSGYTVRSRVEAAIGRYKQVIGDGLGFRKDERRATEVAVAVRP